jgi:hypothetical protein
VKPAKASANDDNPMGICHGSHGKPMRQEKILSRLSSPVIYVLRERGNNQSG